jgi:hypothetical protein
MHKWWVFTCKLCHETFYVPFNDEDEQTIALCNLGMKSTMIYTHECRDGAYGLAELIGATVNSEGGYTHGTNDERRPHTGNE